MALWHFNAFDVLLTAKIWKAIESVEELGLVLVMDVPLELSALAELQTRLIHLAHKWYDIGLQLGLDPAKLEGIRMMSGQTHEECLLRMIELWLKGVQPVATWQDLCRVLEGVVVGESGLAARIRTEKGV